MAEYLIQSGTLDDIVDAINAKTGGSSAMTPAQMVAAIGTISGGNNMIEYATSYGSMFTNVVIPENVDIHAKFSGNFASMIRGSGGIKTLKLATDVPATTFLTFAYGCATLETVDFSGITNGTNLNHNGTFWGCNSLKTIIGLDLSNASNVSNMFNGCSALESVTIKQNTCSIDISFSASANLSNASLVSIANGIAVGNNTLTLNATPKAKLQTIVGTVVNGVFTEELSGSTTLLDFITNTKGWTVA